MVFLSGAWVSADPATDFIFLVDFGSESIFEALDATLFEVFSFVAIYYFPFSKLFCSDSVRVSPSFALMKAAVAALA